jgi:hypothetical protein
MNNAAGLPRARTEGLVISELDDETLVYDLERHEAHCLNQTAALVWRRCDGKTTVAKMTDVIQEQLDTSIDVDIVWLAIKQLQRFHLIANGDELLVATPSVSRRKLLLKYAPAALALPVIMSIHAPTAAQTGSCQNENSPCSVDSDCCSFNCNGGTCGPAL